MEILCELKNVTKVYGDNRVLEEFSLQIQKGEFIAITGKSGSGKSSLLNMIGLLEKQDSGRISIFGEMNIFDNRKRVKELLRDKISYLFQNFALMDNDTIGNNLEVPLIGRRLSKREKESRKLKVLADVRLDLSLKQKVYELSGGEQQRLAIARLLLKPSELILADEPTGSLDETNRSIILDWLKLLNEDGKTVVVVTHDNVVAQYCDRVIQIGHRGEQ